MEHKCLESRHSKADPQAPPTQRNDISDFELSLENERAVTKFLEYLRIRTVHPDCQYNQAIEFLRSYAEETGLQFESFEIIPGKPIALMKWEGDNTELRPILLNSHTDVVPVYPDMWHVDPFEGVIMDGKIYARGTQDMKCVTIQHIEAIRRLKESGKRFQRTVYLSFVPDEEIGGGSGMKLFVEQDKFRDINPAVVLDEGLANPNNAYTIFYGERKIWWLRVRAEGPTGHGSRFVQGTAVSKLIRFCNRMLEFRGAQEMQLTLHNGLKLGDVTTINLNSLIAGVSGGPDGAHAYNVVPREAEAGFDIRVATTVNLEHLMGVFQEWATQDGVFLELIEGGDENRYRNPVSPTTDECIWWSTLVETLKVRGKEVEPEVFPAATDSRYIRLSGLLAYGFSPMSNTPILLHDHNEWIGVSEFCDGIDAFVDIITALANIGEVQ